ncbi:MAG: cyclic nucleotide-binding domain-containing protein [Gammaproteobacteria bacterium]|nr:cyclic nucleotide-binding domain-containing protein [Gammaproteobacteria bacterium]MCW8959891.1 cyclic nucleotide-binding domain-containing protein [Gammaproteobacteria bacterium]MCW8972372.1 cyclic nucleotide-binding domain-containing protein [Gammaproteobacteria bacterium]MCW8992622.1 cyclic nucleotide-binding domain-containing protein [Gammaproteobacteria bacterium]MCW9089134.1 cyclic nucleotide-binding domain-containing protein [Gammaproteobacteria bacterium]
MGEHKNINLNEFLNQQYLCEAMTTHEIQTLLDFTEEVQFKKNGIIADIGEVGEALYFVVEGEAALLQQSGNETVEIGRAGAGGMIGSMSFFDRQPRSVRIIAMSDNTRLLRLSRTMYSRLRIEHPFIAVNLLEDAIVSLDALFRRVSQDVAAFSRYVYGGAR